MNNSKSSKKFVEFIWRELVELERGLNLLVHQWIFLLVNVFLHQKLSHTQSMFKSKITEKWDIWWYYTNWWERNSEFWFFISRVSVSGVFCWETAWFSDTRGTLFFDVERILKEKQPKGFLLENVEGLVTHDRVDRKEPVGRTLSNYIRD